MIGSVELITPAKAEAMLAKNAANRPITTSLVRRYAAEMRAGQWNTNGQGIIFTPEGALLDGQHRLKALIEAGVSLEMFVVRGVPAERFETMDSGRARTTGDVLGAQGFKNANNLAAIARLSWNYAAGMGVSFSAHKPTLIAFVHAHPYLTEITARMVTAKSTLLPASPLGAVLFVANEGHYRLERQAREFFQGVTTGEDLTKGDARLALRSWFYQQQARARGAIGTELAFVAVARAWNAFAHDRELTVIKPIFSPSRRNLPIFDWEAEGFTDVEDLAARSTATALANLAKSPRRQPSAA